MQTSEARVDLKQLLEGAELPALPQSAVRLLELSQDPENGPAEFAVPIESDPGLTGQVLRFVNSSYFGFRHEISNVKLAIALVGIRTIKNFALWSAVFSLMPNPKCGLFDLMSLWQDSLRRGIFARAFGKMLGSPDAEDLFAAAVLQDMAIPLLAKEMPGRYQELLQSRDGGLNRLSDLEQAQYGWTHAQAGGMLARMWTLPESFAARIETHRDVDSLAAGADAKPGNSAVVLSGLLPSVCDDLWTERDRFTDLYHSLSGQNAPPLTDVFEQVDSEFTEFAPVLKLSSPAKALADRLREPETAPP